MKMSIKLLKIQAEQKNDLRSQYPPLWYKKKKSATSTNCSRARKKLNKISWLIKNKPSNRHVSSRLYSHFNRRIDISCFSSCLGTNRESLMLGCHLANIIPLGLVNKDVSSNKYRINI